MTCWPSPGQIPPWSTRTRHAASLRGRSRAGH